jgi:hypothetical protein
MRPSCATRWCPTDRRPRAVSAAVAGGPGLRWPRWPERRGQDADARRRRRAWSRAGRPGDHSPPSPPSCGGPRLVRPHDLPGRDLRVSQLRRRAHRDGMGAVLPPTVPRRRDLAGQSSPRPVRGTALPRRHVRELHRHALPRLLEHPLRGRVGDPGLRGDGGAGAPAHPARGLRHAGPRERRPHPRGGRGATSTRSGRVTWPCCPRWPKWPGGRGARRPHRGGADPAGPGSPGAAGGRAGRVRDRGRAGRGLAVVPRRAR